MKYKVFKTLWVFVYVCEITLKSLSFLSLWRTNVQICQAFSKTYRMKCFCVLMHVFITICFLLKITNSCFSIPQSVCFFHTLKVVAWVYGFWLSFHKGRFKILQKEQSPTWGVPLSSCWGFMSVHRSAVQNLHPDKVLRVGYVSQQSATWFKCVYMKSVTCLRLIHVGFIIVIICTAEKWIVFI